MTKHKHKAAEEGKPAAAATESLAESAESAGTGPALVEPVPTGVRRRGAGGVPCDPNLHEGVPTAPADEAAKDHTVGTVLQAGYRLGTVLLRPARVVVLTWQGGPGGGEGEAQTS